MKCHDNISMAARTLLSLSLVLTTGTLSPLHVQIVQAAEPQAGGANAEQAVMKRVKEYAQKQGAALVHNRKWVEISLPDAVKQALGNNIALKQSAMKSKLAAQTVVVNKSAFDPSLSASTGYSRSNTFDRVEKDFKFFKGTTTCAAAPTPEVRATCLAEGINKEDPLTKTVTGPEVYRFMNTPVPVAYLRYTTVKPAGNELKPISASKASLEGPTEKANYSLSLGKRLPWGAAASINQTTTRQERDWTLNGEGRNPIVGSYDRPWVSSLSATVSVPVPGSKYYGPLAPIEVDLKQAKYSEQKANTENQVSVDAVLLSVENAYWTLAGQVRMLAAAIQNRNDLAKLAIRTAELEQRQLVTEYSRLQVEAEMSKAQSAETAAWESFVLASNQLNQTLKFNADVLFLPVGYDQLLAIPQYDMKQLLAQGVANNSEIRAQAIAVQASDLALQQKKVQIRPDASLAFSASGSQSNSAFGYESYTDSMKNLLDPDAITLSGTASVNYAWKNRSAKASLGQAQVQKEYTELGRKVLENQTTRITKDAYSALVSAKARVGIAQTYLTLAQAAYDKAKRLQTEGRVTEYELIVKNGDLLAAENQYILAQISTRKAEAALLAATGSLAQKYSGAQGAGKELVGSSSPSLQEEGMGS